jgi:hypothetical protein
MESAFFQDVEHRDVILASAFHAHIGAIVGKQPVPQLDHTLLRILV